MNCQECGACCSYSYDWPELWYPADAAVPEHMITEDGQFVQCDGDRCIALQGVVGKLVNCSIYHIRPVVCRTCMPGDDACRLARKHFNLEDK